MNFRFIILILTLMAPASLVAATANAYTNLVSITSPPQLAPNIDARLFVNKAYFEINDFRIFQALPYETDNTLMFINDVSGTMAGSPGFRFTYYRPINNSRSWMSSWLNRGTITTESTNQFFFSGTAQWLLVSATNILNSGLLNAGPQSLIQLEGRTVDLSRSRIRTGTSPSFIGYSGGFNLRLTNYFNDLGITDVYWAEGNSNVVSGMGAPMQLNVPGGIPSFSPPYRSAQHETIQNFGGILFTNQGVVLGDLFFQSNVLTAAYSNIIGGEIVIQAVFVKTNSFEPHITPEIRFVPDIDNGRTAVVGFHSRERDVAFDRDITNSVYLLDALAFDTNVVLARNQTAPTRKPTNYEVTKGLFFTQFSLTNEFRNYVPYTSSLLYRDTFVDSAVGVQYAAYAANITSFSLFNGGFGGLSNDPTNFPGRIEIRADTLNLKETRIRADSTLILEANNLVSNSLARINAPFINFDVGTTQPALIISNLAPVSVNRLSGGIQAWSATWRNTDVLPNATNNWRFHVLFVDNTLTTNQPVFLNKFHARAANIVICDPLTVRQSIRLQGSGVHIKTNGSVVFPPNTDWTAATVVNVVNFTNDGRMQIPGAGFVGSDRGWGYNNFINRGTNDAAVWSIMTDRFENPGCMAATAGGFDVTATRAVLEGRPPTTSTLLVPNFSTFPPTLDLVVVTNFAAKIAAVTDVAVNASIITLSNAYLVAGASGVPGAVILNAASRLTDAGPAHTNRLIASGGVRVLQKPSQGGDLMGTYALVQAPPFSEAQNIWASHDAGPTVMGFSNNLALGKLTLDGGEASVIRFAGVAGKKTAIYVDYLELLNNATNYTGDNLGLVIDPSVVIYFAHANITASKLDRAQNEHIRWVRNFYGPLSTTNIVYPSGNVYSMNISLAQDKDADSDGDGTTNIKDPTPIYTAESVDLQIAHDAQPNRVLLSWRALANSTSHIEYRPVIVSTAPWQLLRSTSAPSTMRLSTTDLTTGTGRTQRIYRVRVDLPPQ